MGQINIEIENLKCGGCAKTIKNGLESIAGVSKVEIHHETNSVSMDAEENSRQAIASKLASMGYPEKGTVQGFEKGMAVAKSYVSCAIGKVS